MKPLNPIRKGILPIHLPLLLCLLAMLLNRNPNPFMNETQAAADSQPTEAVATLGGGCFWCVEAVFERLPGVKGVTSGYSGGKKDTVTYEEVCTGTTGHAEVIQITYDPKVVSYERLLEVFWFAHDPTTLNRQGADSGTQYRSIILYHDEAQKKAAEKSKADAAKHFDRPIVTEITALTKYIKAEPYHQDYFRNNPQARYCSYVIRPKLEKLEKTGTIPKAK